MAASRKAVVLEKLTQIIAEMSGLQGDAIDPTTSFLDLGFDSLFLTQANLRFRRELKVKITFRQLFDEAPCLDALADYVDKQLPAGAFQDEMASTAPAPAAVAAAAAPSAAAPSAGHAAPNGASGFTVPSLQTMGLDAARISGGMSELMRVLVLQSQTNTALLEALGMGASMTPLAAQPQAIAAPQAIAQPVAPVAPAASVAPPTPAAREPQAPKAFGPYKPVEKGSGGLNDAAKAALNEFCEAYSQRTRKSKALAQEQRGVLSDARSISGFRKDFKEIVYQLAAGRGSKGSRVWDLDGNEYIDMTSSFGISLFGHSPQYVVDAAKDQLEAGFELGTLSPLAKESAELIRDLTGMDRSTFTNTGSEALAAAVRAARTTTGKDRIAVFYDEYHGIGDELLVNCVDTPSGRKTIPTSPGIPEFLVENVLVLKWDDPDFLGTIREHADDLAAVIIEPVQNRNPSLNTAVHFQAIRELTREHGIAMIFDEMITGFRLAPGGAQEYFGVDVDIACYGKVVSGGMPLAVVSGRGEYLDCFDGGPWSFGDDSFPEAGVTFFGGTYTRHPIALATCHASLTEIKRVGRDAYTTLNQTSRRFANRVNELLIGTGFPARIENRESIFNLKWDDANPFSRLLLWQLRHRGVMIYDRPFFMTTSHSEADLDFVIDAFRSSIAYLQESGIVPKTAIDGDTSGARAVPFNQSQVEVWLATKFSQDTSRALHEQVSYKLNGAIDTAALRHAIQRVVHRHEGLRARENASGEGWIVEPAVHIPLNEVDLSGLPDAEREAELARLIKRDVVEDFDLASGPLVRFSLFKTNHEEYTLVLSAHHIVIDGWSMGVLLSDLAAYYGAASRSERFGEAAPHSLTTFVAEETEYLASEEYRDAEAFWVKQFADSIPKALELPLDYPRPPLSSHLGSRQSLRFPAELHTRLSEFRAEKQVTLFTVLYAGFSAMMAHLTGQHDVVLGVPMAGQAAAGQPFLVGHAVNFLPLRLQVNPQRSFAQLLADTQEYILELNDYQRYTYGSLLRKLLIKRTSERPPLISVMFNVDQAMDTFDFGGVEARYVPSTKGYVKHDLFLNVVLERDGAVLEFDHSSDVLKPETVVGWMEQFFELLRMAIRDSSAPLESIFHRLASTDAAVVAGGTDDRVLVGASADPGIRGGMGH
jgi:glutamate-1-semialdehyde aminotransferase/acyl carrier protein